MCGYIYKTTNNINGKFYIGKRQKTVFDIYYYGSGKYLSSALCKYGKENFSREILEWCESLEELNNKERFWINKLDARNPDIGYNIAEGGEGGGDFGKNNSLYCFVHNQDEMFRILKEDLPFYIEQGYSKGRGYASNGLVGVTKSKETKQKISDSNKGKHNHKGDNNPCFGVKFFWINNGIVNKRVPLDAEVPDGWRRGKIQKKPERTEKFITYLERRKTDKHWSGDNNPGKKMIGTCWYNNSINEIRIKDTAIIPEGYVKGRLKRER